MVALLVEHSGSHRKPHHTGYCECRLGQWGTIATVHLRPATLVAAGFIAAYQPSGSLGGKTNLLAWVVRFTASTTPAKAPLGSGVTP